MKCTAACFISLSILATVLPAQAADVSYLGTWKLTDAVVAPWADAKQKPDAAEKARLIGKSVVLAPKAITGPSPFACAAPHYKVSNFAADMIFQGAFGEMQSTNKAADPNQIAASLGFRSRHQDAGNRLPDRLPFRRCHDGGDRPQQLCLYAEEAVGSRRRKPVRNALARPMMRTGALSRKLAKAPARP